MTHVRKYLSGSYKLTYIKVTYRDCETVEIIALLNRKNYFDIKRVVLLLNKPWGSSNKLVLS